VVETHFSSPGDGARVVVVANDALYAQVAVSIENYAADLISEGYAVTLVSLQPKTTAPQLRSYLHSVKGIKGALLVGSLPTVHFKYGTEQGGTGPCDFYYMDLDGTWEDTNSDGILDLHTQGSADRACEIWVSRLSATKYSFIEGWSEAQYINNYFKKNHAYRLGQFRSSIPHRALVYPDDHASSPSQRGLENVYPQVDVVYEPSLTTADDFLNTRLTACYEFVHVVAHSSEKFSMFYRGNKNMYNKIYSEDIAAIDPKGLFFMLEACSNADYTSTNYMAGYYIFSKSYGLAAVGLTREASTALSNKFYDKLAPHSRWSLGEAYRFWINSVVFNGVAYALTLLGDGTLGIDPPVAEIANLSIINGTVTLQGRGSLHGGSIIGHRWSSSINGQLGNDSVLTDIKLSKGTHTISYQVKDSCSRWSTACLDTVVIAQDMVAVHPGQISVEPRVEGSTQLLTFVTLNGRFYQPQDRARGELTFEAGHRLQISSPTTARSTGIVLRTNRVLH
jgi:hypothetical protein